MSHTFTPSEHEKRPLRVSRAPAVGIEPTTNRLTGDCSTTELHRNIKIIAKFVRKAIVACGYFGSVYNKYMNIKIRSKNFDITPAIDDYVSKKVSSLEKFLDPNKETLAEVEVGKTTNHHKSGEIYRAEINIVEPGSKQVFVFAEEIDLYTAIDIMRDEAERAIVSKKNKKLTLFRKGSGAVKDLLKRISFKRK